MRALRSYLTLLLVGVFALTGVSAHAGMRDATGQMVICTGSGPVMVYIDSDGAPTSPPSDCPECLTFAVFVPTQTLHVQAQAVVMPPWRAMAGAFGVAPIWSQANLARAPPVLGDLHAS
ncbi:hypothetical protein [Phaeobacter sp.]|uniref:hypothetical protein n=1 Tax=Phaeobacter sp. TaxID=1902409 RepID=UPI0025D75526|nr:hypothetical protein [Phaeobacter sp.]